MYSKNHKHSFFCKYRSIRSLAIDSQGTRDFQHPLLHWECKRPQEQVQSFPSRKPQDLKRGREAASGKLARALGQTEPAPPRCSPSSGGSPARDPSDPSTSSLSRGWGMPTTASQPLCTSQTRLFLLRAALIPPLLTLLALTEEHWLVLVKL